MSRSMVGAHTTSTLLVRCAGGTLRPVVNAVHGSDIMSIKYLRDELESFLNYTITDDIHLVAVTKD